MARRSRLGAVTRPRLYCNGRFEPRRLQRVNQRRRNHDRIVFERERRHHQARGWQSQEVAERCPDSLESLRLGRPAQLTKERGRVEDVPVRGIRPFPVDKPRKLDSLEVPEPRALGIDEVNPVSAGARRERVCFDPPPDDRSDGIEINRERIEPRIRVAQARQRVEHCRPTP